MNNIEDGISIKELFGIIFKNIVLIVLVTMLFIVVGTVLAFTKTPTYEVKTKTLVSINIEDGVGVDGITTSLRLLETIEGWFSTNLVLDGVREELNNLEGFDTENQYTRSYIRSKITSESSTSNLYVTVYFKDKDLANAVVIANLIREVGTDLWNKEGADGLSNNSISSTTFISTDEATIEDASDISLSKKMYLLISAFCGGLISVSFVLIKELSSNKLKSKEQVEKISGLKIISVIPNLKSRG